MVSYDIKLDSSENLYVTGRNYQIDTINALPYTGLTFIAEFNTDHQLIWGTYFGGNTTNKYDYIRDMVFIDTALYLVGETQMDNFPAIDPGGSVYYKDTLSGSSDAFIAKFVNHVPVWSTYFGGDSADAATGICAGADNNYYISGFTLSSDFPVLDAGSPAYYEGSLQGNAATSHYNGYNGDAFLSEFSSSDQQMHTTYYGSTDGEGFSDIGIDSQGNLYLTGESASSSIPFASPNLSGAFIRDTLTDNQDGIIVSFNDDLELQWTSYFGGSYTGTNYDWITDLVVTDNGNLFVVGVTNSSDDFSWVHAPLAYIDSVNTSDDAFVAKFDILMSNNIKQIESLNDNMLVFPNPATETIYIDSEEKAESYIIYNLTGQQVTSGRYKNGINISKLSAGMYILEVSNKTARKSVKIIKN